MWLRKNRVVVALLLFLVLYAGLFVWQPAWLYRKDGSLRTFGVGYKQKTILPLWLLSIGLGLLCYLSVHAYILQFSSVRGSAARRHLRRR